ncbi:MAG: efflux RND transporter permease subunit [Opitutaceae bacterium]
MNSERKPLFGDLATRYALAIVFIAAVLCLAGVFAALNMPSSVFPQTNFPRVVILADNGIIPAGQMMATVTRPIEEAMKEIPGCLSVRSATTRGSAQIDVVFDWHVDMVRSELYVLSHLAEIRSELPTTVTTAVSRVTFSAFPIIGVSLTSSTRNLMSLWDTGEYTLKPRFLQIPGVASVEIVGGRTPEYHVIVDPRRLQAAGLALSDVTGALNANNVLSPAGMIEQNYHLYLTTVDGRVHSASGIGNLVVAVRNGHPIRIADVARVQRAPAPSFTVVTAEGHNAVLLNVMSQPDGSTLDIAKALKAQIARLRTQLPPDMRLTFFYDQSSFVKESVGSVWEAIVFGLILSVAILYCFLKNWGTVLTAVVAIPVTVLITFISMRMAGMSFNMMTLGGIAAAIGLVIDDAIVVVETIYAKVASGSSRHDGIREGIAEILHPLVASTLTPVVVFIPLAFLVGIAGVFFRALAMTMVVSLLTSLALAVTLTPSLAAWFVRNRKHRTGAAPLREAEGGFLFRRAIRVYESGLRSALRHRWLTMLACAVIAVIGVGVYRRLGSNFLPSFDEGGFVIDYNAPAGTSLSETSRMLDQAEKIIGSDPDVEGYSRRLGTQLGLFITEPYSGDFLVKLKASRKHTTDEVIDKFRKAFNERLPAIRWDFHGILGDLVGDLVLAPDPIEIKLFSPDLAWLEREAPTVERKIKSIPGVVDTFDGLTETGPSIVVRIRPVDAARYGLTTAAIGDEVNTAMLGQVASHVQKGDRMVNVRVLVDSTDVSQIALLRDLPLRSPDGRTVRLSQVANIFQEPSQMEIDREDLRQNVIVSGRVEGADLGATMGKIKAMLAADRALPPGSVQYGGLYQQQQESFRNLLIVLLMALLLVFTVLVLEFRSFYAPISIVFGAVLALVGSVFALWATGTTLNIVSFLGAIIGVGLVAKNGILMLDFVDRLRVNGLSLEEALVRSGHRRLRPVLMTTLAAALGMLPLAVGVGTGADMLRPLAIAVIGALCISVLLSLLATPTLYYLLLRFFSVERS